MVCLFAWGRFVLCTQGCTENNQDLYKKKDPFRKYYVLSVNKKGLSLAKIPFFIT